MMAEKSTYVCGVCGRAHRSSTTLVDRGDGYVCHGRCEDLSMREGLDWIRVPVTPEQRKRWTRAMAVAIAEDDEPRGLEYVLASLADGWASIYLGESVETSNAEANPSEDGRLEG